MPKPKTSPDLTPKTYRRLKSDLAAKLSAHSQGGITYLLLADTTDTPELHLAVTANEGGGLWSKETIRLSTIEAVLDAYADQPFPTKALRGAMVGRSSNNPPFCLAVLKDLGLVAPAPDKSHQYVKTGDWAAFRAEWLAKPGEQVIYPDPKADGRPVIEMSDASTTEAPSIASPFAPPGKGKKRQKGSEDAMVTNATDSDTALIDEAEHAPTAHA